MRGRARESWGASQADAVLAAGEAVAVAVEGTPLGIGQAGLAPERMRRKASESEPRRDRCTRVTTRVAAS